MEGADLYIKIKNICHTFSFAYARRDFAQTSEQKLDLVYICIYLQYAILYHSINHMHVIVYVYACV